MLSLEVQVRGKRCPLCHIQILSDHENGARHGTCGRALEKISNPRLFSFKERSLMYRFTLKHTLGKAHAGLDATSRYPVASSIHALLHSCNPTAQPALNDINESIKLSRIASLKTDQYFQAITWERVRAAAAQDQECWELSIAINSGFPATKNKLPELVRRYWPMRDELYIVDGVVLRGDRILIPCTL